LRFDTLAVHAGQAPDPTYGAVMTPVFQVSTFAYRGVGSPGPFDYSRSGNPTRKALEDCLAALEGGVRGFAFGTGMAAETTVLALLGKGDHVIVHDDLYGGTYRLLVNVIARQGVDVEFVDLRDLDALRKAIRPSTRLIWAETPTNPLMNILDLRAIAGIARERSVLTACDNTFLSPFFQRPLDLGIDIVLHSTTKYLNGHSDVVGGAAVVKDPVLAEKIYFLQNAMGTCQAPMDCFLVLRGIKTLPLRLRAHERNSLRIGAWLETRPEVLKVNHPGLESHPQRELVRRQMTGSGGTFSFRLKGGRAATERFLGRARLFVLAESLGGVESLIEHPWSMTHMSMPEAARAKSGITDDLVRISVGIEDVEDLIEDLRQALED
jgi:cystathionine gamma-lyase